MKSSYVYNIDNVLIDENTTKKDILLMLKEHDYDSYAFSFFTGAYNYAISKELNESKHNNHRLYFECGLFHDTGKLGMKSDFINFPGEFTYMMYSQMKLHAEGGGTILSKVKNIEKEIIDTANYHHCNYDGSGYPGGLVGEQIPFPARLTRVSDSLDAYLTKRCYKDGGPAAGAFDDLNEYTGESYDPNIINAFSRVHEKVMNECHKSGQDRPSKDLYTHYLIDLYLNDFKVKSINDVLSYI